MHASHVAILVLAASAASPALSAPLAARGTAGVPATSDVVARAVPPALSALDDFLAHHGKPNPGRRPGGIRARDLEDAFLQGIARRDHDVSDSDPHGARAVPPALGALDDFLAQHGRPNPGRRPSGIRARDSEDAFLQAISRRNVSELEPRFGLGTLLKGIKAILGSKKIARRDVTPEQLIALVSLASLPLDSLD